MKNDSIVQSNVSQSFRWPDGRSCAISLTYDDALPIHHEYVGPALASRGLRGTFYLFIGGIPMDSCERWRGLAIQGHELGNHSLFHPCRREPAANFPWLDEGFDLRSYTPYRFELEMRVANLALHLIDGKEQRSYGNTCSDTTIGDGDRRQSMDSILRKCFVAARGAMTNRMAVVSSGLNLMNVGHLLADFRTFNELRQEICNIREAGGWGIYAMHGVGAETKELYIEREDHERLLDWLAGETDIWVEPFLDVASWIRQWQDNLNLGRPTALTE